MNDSQPGTACDLKTCFRVVIDDFISKDEVRAIHDLTEAGMKIGGGGAGGPTLVDFANGIVSVGENFAKLYEMVKRATDKGARSHDSDFTTANVEIYRDVVRRIHGIVSAITGRYSSDGTERALLLTPPSFISRIASADVHSPNDEYWHDHVDTDQYGTFSVTTLLYLNSKDEDYTGGSFKFVGATPTTVEPRAGRLLVFTSGRENPHSVEKVEQILVAPRYAMTTAFACPEGVEGHFTDVTDSTFLRSAFRAAEAIHQP